jgi:HSP20 family protein
MKETDMKNKEIAVRQNSTAQPIVATESVEQYTVPAADIYETPDAYMLVLDLPGATKEGISVKLDNNELTVKAAVEPLHPEGGALLYRELEAAGYYREFTIGEGIDRNTVDAHFDKGVLSIKLFKSEELKPRNITIR